MNTIGTSSAQQDNHATHTTTTATAASMDPRQPKVAESSVRAKGCAAAGSAVCDIALQNPIKCAVSQQAAAKLPMLHRLAWTHDFPSK